jgi:cellulose synthase/poly-beta-1,6-N-acetylglucosamine synthase-like glycosyltransferase
LPLDDELVAALTALRKLIGVVDSDYQLEPGFLRRCASAFADPWVAFIQAPQDYRGWAHAPYYRRLYYSYKYFFAGLDCLLVQGYLKGCG